MDDFALNARPRSQRQVFWVQGQPGVGTVFQDCRESYVMKPWLGSGAW